MLVQFIRDKAFQNIYIHKIKLHLPEASLIFNCQKLPNNPYASLGGASYVMSVGSTDSRGKNAFSGELQDALGLRKRASCSGSHISSDKIISGQCSSCTVHSCRAGPVPQSSM